MMRFLRSFLPEAIAIGVSTVLLLLVEAALLMAAALQPHWAAVYVFVGAVVLYWFAVRSRKRSLR